MTDKKYLQQHFIDAATKKHNGKYDYSKVEYTKSYLPVTIICPIHGEYKQIPHNHLRYAGCSGCRADNQSNRQSLTQDEFIQRSKYLWGDKYSYANTVYTRSSAKVTITCSKHNADYSITANTHLVPSKEHQCPYCRLEVTKKKFGTKAQFVATTKYVDVVLYVLKVTSRHTRETFYRVGITRNKAGLLRTIRATQTKYNVLIIHEESMSAAKAYDLETRVLVGNREFHYVPMVMFTGSQNQCFSELDLTKYL